MRRLLEVPYFQEHLVAEVLDNILALLKSPFEVLGMQTFVIWL